ncbi:MAG: signal peptidase II [Candidatus Marinimicrobia bacterium]|nr:signal peptidase II [Candidatus Neomarinimicrobiota bacterium]|tara:strand:- start:4551 stop:5042 length:492 start_codon:yes stop_codon:yes gene_type:complete
MFYFIIALVVFSLDQVSKYLIKTNLELYQPLNIISHYLRFTYCENSGMAFGIQLGPYVHILTFISIIFTFYIIYFLYQNLNNGLLIKLSIAFILGGALGNIYDRVFMFLDPENVGGVVDFIDVGISMSIRWYIFNIADSAITIGIVLYLIHTIFFEEDEPKLT